MGVLIDGVRKTRGLSLVQEIVSLRLLKVFELF